MYQLCIPGRARNLLYLWWVRVLHLRAEMAYKHSTDTTRGMYTSGAAVSVQSCSQVHNIGLVEVSHIQEGVKDLIQQLGQNVSFKEFASRIRADVSQVEKKLN